MITSKSPSYTVFDIDVQAADGVLRCVWKQYIGRGYQCVPSVVELVFKKKIYVVADQSSHSFPN